MEVEALQKDLDAKLKLLAYKQTKGEDIVTKGNATTIERHRDALVHLAKEADEIKLKIEGKKIASGEQMEEIDILKKINSTPNRMAPPLRLLSLWLVFLHFQYVTTEVRVPCGMVEDWFPGDVDPQSSNPPYVLDVIRQRDRKSVLDDLYQNKPRYDWHENYTIFLNGTGSEEFTGFMIFIYNEFEDEESGHFVKPLPAGVSMKECHFNQTSQWVEYVENSTSSNRWSSLQVNWESPRKYPAGKITLSASVVKEQGVYWKGITLTLNHVCAIPGCSIPGDCPDGLAKNKYGCEICECAGAGSIAVGFTSLLVIALTLLSNLI